jgi:membrane associated rhomboid family serine protease
MSLLSVIRKPIHYSFFNITLWLIGINVGLYILTLINPSIFLILMLNSRVVLSRGYFWQIFTYMFLHDLRSFTHILFNMFALFVFGLPLERRLGSTEFLLLYLITGTLTGLVALILGMNVVGASGAIYGLLLGFATFYPDTTLFVGFFLPIKARIAVIVFAVLSLVLNFIDPHSGIAHLVHLAGIIFSFLYFLIRLNINPIKVIFKKDDY